MKKILLRDGEYVIVDNEDFAWLNQWQWHLSTSGYVRRAQYVRGSGYGKKDYKAVNVTMHRLINKTPDGFFTDHINQNKLDNRKCNLRTTNKSLNGLNRANVKLTKSGRNGVHFDSWTGKWRAEMKINGVKKSLGRFININDAVLARKKAEQEILWNIKFQC